MTVNYYTGPAQDVLAMRSAGSVHSAVTSPPYWGPRDYGSETVMEWPEMSYHPMPGLPALAVPAWHGQLGQEPTVELYIGHLLLVFRALYRVLRRDGVLFVNLGDTYTGSRQGPLGESSSLHQKARTAARTVVPGSGIMVSGVGEKNMVGVPARLAFAMQAECDEAGRGMWTWRDDVIWQKHPGMPERVTNRTTRQHENILMFTKHPRHYWYDWVAIAEKLQAATTTRYQYGRNAGNKQADRPGPQAVHTLALPRADYNDAPALRRARSVWRIPNPGFSGAHFAVMPPELARRLVLIATPAYCCPGCGAGWVREFVEAEAINRHKHESRRQAATQHSPSQLLEGGKLRASVAVGWQPGCRCLGNDGSGRGVVLDPFAGAGTVSLVAERGGRDSIYVDAVAGNAEIAEERIQQDGHQPPVAADTTAEQLPSWQQLPMFGSLNTYQGGTHRLL